MLDKITRHNRSNEGDVIVMIIAIIIISLLIL